jgi:DmsE family decaheme c-type cytochrome
MAHPRILLLIAIVGGALLGFAALQTTTSISQTAQAASYVGSEACSDCHEDQMRSFRVAGHGRAEHDSTLVDSKVGCESCHGPGSLHVKADGDRDDPGFWSMKNLEKMKPEEANAECTTCHAGGAQMHWDNSVHRDQNLKCIQCHSMHDAKDAGQQALLKTSNTSELCMTCHKSKRMQFARSAHMPVLEGGMDCSSCHDPHGSAGPTQIRANSVNELCESCHMDKRGPMLFEHAPVRENCTNCHEPHGANNQKSLAAKTPFLCQRCHVATRHPSTLYDGPDLASNRLFNRSCLNCHSQIHGSNHPSGKYLLR